MPAVSMFMLSAALLAATPIDRPSTLPVVHISIEQEPGVQLDEADIDAIAQDIARIWRPAADVIVTAEGPAGLFARDQVRLVLTARSLPDEDAAGIGWVAFVDGQPQPVLTVSLAAVSRLLVSGTWSGRPFANLPARAATLFMRRAVARAAAHELGHYLLRTKDHARRGLMRAVFTVEEIMSGGTKHNRLEPALLAALNAREPERTAARDRPLKAYD